MKEINFIEIFSLLISFTAIIVSFLCYSNAKRELFINAYSSYRIEWINNLRNLVFQFIEYKYSNKKNKMLQCKHKIDVLLNFKYKDHYEFSQALNLCINNKIELEKVLYMSQILIDNYWMKAKTEAKMDKRTNVKVSKKTYS